MGERVVLDVAGAVAQRLELGQRARRPARRRSTKPTFDDLASAFCRSGSASAASALSLKSRRGDDSHHARPLVRARGSPIGGVPVMPASTSATWRTCDRRCPRAAACRPCSSGSRDRRRAACRRRSPRCWPAFLPTMALEISGYLTQNVPPKPQQTSASGISRERQARRTLASSWRGCALTPSSRRPEQES